MSWFTTRRLGKPIWDYLGNHKVEAEPISPFRIAALVLVFILFFLLKWAILWPHVEKSLIEQSPENKELFEQIDIWHFPVRK